MKDQNYTLRYARSWRELNGCDCEFEKFDPDRFVGRAAFILAVFVIGMLVGGL
jgi:hypothetical protein